MLALVPFGMTISNRNRMDLPLEVVHVVVFTGDVETVVRRLVVYHRQERVPERRNQMDRIGNQIEKCVHLERASNRSLIQATLYQIDSRLAPSKHLVGTGLLAEHLHVEYVRIINYIGGDRKVSSSF